MKRPCTGENHVHGILKCPKLEEEGHEKCNVDEGQITSINGYSENKHLCLSEDENVRASHKDEKRCNWDESTYSLPKGEPRVILEAPDTFQEFDKIILKFMKEQKIPGASICIGHKGKIVHKQAYGWASENVPVKTDDRFRIASITKALTATGVMKLVEQGHLKLQDKAFGPKGILNHFSLGPKADRRLLKITVKHLLQHSAGWDREEVGDPVFWRHVGKEMNVPEPVPQTVLIEYMLQQKLQFSPGTKHVYSNFGYCVLGRIIEKVSGESYENFIKALLRLVDITEMKLGRTKKHLTEPDEVEYFAGPRCNFVDSIYAEDGRVPAPYGGFAMETGDSDGGWIATAEDLVRFFQALDGTGPKRIISTKSFKAMTERPCYMKGSSAWYGFGLDVSWNRKAWEHSGTLDGATSSLVRDNNGYVYAMLCNYWPEDSDYTSIMSYAMKRAPQLSKTKIATVQHTDAATLDKCYAITLRLPKDEFPTKLETMSSLGYSASWISACQFNGSLHFSVIWTNKEKNLKVFYDLTEDDLSKYADNPKVSIKHIDSYTSNESILFCIIVSESEHQNTNTQKSQILLPNVEITDIDKEIADHKERGFAATRLSIASTKSDSKATILFESHDSNSKVWVKTEMNSTIYQSDFNKHAKYGHMMTYVKPYYNSSDQLFFTTIWTNSGSFQYTSEFDMSKYRLLNDFLFVAEKGYQPWCISGYEEEDAEKYVAICIKEVPPNSVS